MDPRDVLKIMLQDAKMDYGQASIVIKIHDGDIGQIQIPFEKNFKVSDINPNFVVDHIRELLDRFYFSGKTGTINFQIKFKNGVPKNIIESGYYTKTYDTYTKKYVTD